MDPNGPQNFIDLVNQHQSQSATQQFNQAFQKVGPLTSGFSSAYTGMGIDQKLVQKQQESQSFFQKIANVGKQSFDIGQSIVKGLGGFAVHSAQDIGKAGYLTAVTARDLISQPFTSRIYEQQTKMLEVKQDAVMNAYKRGAMSKKDYIKALDDIDSELKILNHNNTKELVEGVTPTDRAMAVVNTAATVLSLGSLGMTEVGGKEAIQALGNQGGKEALRALVDQAATPLERMIMKVPAGRALLMRNIEQMGTRTAQQLAGETTSQFLVRESRSIAADLLIKRPVFYQQNIASAKDIYTKLIDGNYSSALKSSAWMATQMLDGGPVGAFFNGLNWMKGRLKPLAYGTDSLIDTLSKEIGDKNPQQVAKYINSLKEGSEERAKVEKIYRILQETNLRVADEDVKLATDNILRHYDYAGIERSNITPKMLAEDYAHWHEAADILKNQVKKIPGLTSDQIDNLVVVRWDSVVKKGLAKVIREAGDDRQAIIDAVQEYAGRPGIGWGQNRLLTSQVYHIIVEADSAEQAAKKIMSIPATDGMPKGLSKRLTDKFVKLGYGIAVPAKGVRQTPLLDVEDTRKLVTAAMAHDTELFDVAQQPAPVISQIAGLFEHLGLSPRSANEAGFRKLSENLTANIAELPVAKTLGMKADDTGDMTNGGRAVLSLLQRYIDDMKPSAAGNVLVAGRATGSSVNDIRQLTVHEVMDALKVTKSEARQVMRAVNKGYLDTPLELRGMGDKVVDTLYAINPLQKYYSRIQSSLRYNYNPFFRTQEAVETNLLSGIQGGNKFSALVDHNLIWNKTKNTLDDGVKIMDNAGMFESSFSGEAAQDQIFGRITANITAGQKRDLAGLAMDIAKTKGITLEELVKKSPEDVMDAMRVVVQYPRNGILASPLARTMNLVFFPVRYNAKVTMVAAKVLAKQPPSVQKAVIHSLFNVREWLKSDEGIAWQSKHTDAIQVFNWLTPINSIESTLNLLGHKPDSLAEIGQLGGLPLGIITQILDSQGIINLNRPYVDPKTGDVIPKYVPETAKARAATALGDLLGSMFTYPGRVLGLPGKGQMIRSEVKNIIDTNGTDFNKLAQDDNLTPLQKNWVRVLGGDHSKEAIDALYNAPAPGNFNWYTIPPMNIPLEKPNVEYKAPKTSKKIYARPMNRQ